MSERTKRIIYISLFVVVVIGAGLGIYFLFFAPDREEEVVVEEGQTLEEVIDQLLPTIGVGDITTIEDEPEEEPETIPVIADGEEVLAAQIVDQETEALDIDQGNNLRYFNPDDGNFYRINADGTRTKLSDEVFRGVEDVAWAPKEDMAILEFPDGSNVVYDFEKDSQVTLPEEMTAFGFNDEGDKIAYKYDADDPDSRWLGVANPDGTGVEGINFLGENGGSVDVNWSPNNTVVGTYLHGEDTNRMTVSFLGLNNENFKGMIVEGRGFEGIWSPNGQQMLYSIYHPDTNYNPTLWIADASGDNIGENRRNLGLQTWVDKCGFNTSGSTVYCGVPDALPVGTGLVPSNADDIPHSIYKIDLRSGAISRVAIPTIAGGGNFSISSVHVPDDEASLIFQEAKTGQVYSIRLK